MSHSSHSANYIRVVKAVVLKPHQNSSTFSNRSSSCFEYWTRIFSILRDSANTQKSVILLFHLNSRRIVHIHRILLHSRAYPATCSELNPKFGTQSNFQDTPPVPWQCVQDSDPITKHGPAWQLLEVLHLLLAHRDPPPCPWRRHVRRSAGVQQFQH